MKTIIMDADLLWNSLKRKMYKTTEVVTLPLAGFDLGFFLFTALFMKLTDE